MRDIQEEARIVRELTRYENGSDPFASAVRATRMPMLITDPRLPDNAIVFVNDAFTKLTGYDRSEIIGHNCRFLQGADSDMDDVMRVRDAIRDQVPIEIDLLNYKKFLHKILRQLEVFPPTPAQISTPTPSEMMP